MEKENIIQQKSFNFVLKTIQIFQNLHKRREFILFKQFLRSATSIGADIGKALAAQSKRKDVYNSNKRHKKQSFGCVYLIAVKLFLWIILGIWKKLRILVICLPK